MFDMITENKPEKIEPVSNPKQEELRGRSVFLVETTSSGIAVQTSFMTDDGKLFQMPAIFSDVQYALAQIDELRILVAQHFSRAAQVGAQVITQQMASQAESIRPAADSIPSSEQETPQG